MAHNQSRSVAELRRESERTRAELSETVESLRMKITDTAADIRQKVSPDHIKAEVIGYVAGKSRQWLHALKQQAMENPIQALAAGSAVAIPAFKFIRGVPPPLLMIGAGLVLASPRVRGAVTDKMSETLKTSDGANVIDETTQVARENWQSAKARAEGAVDEARSTMSAKAADVREAATEMADDARRRAAELSDTAARSLSSAGETLSAQVDAASEAAKQALDATSTKAAETFKTTRASAENLVRDNAALVGGLGLAIGALIAASLPSSRAERDTLGEASDTLRKTTAEAASEIFEEAKTAAASAADSATEKLKTVTDEAITTAFEPSQIDDR